MEEKRRFVASYSGGKDCNLAICRALERGMVPMGLITTYNTNLERSWFHGIPAPILEQVAEALAMPVSLIRTDGSDYEALFVRELRRQKALGAEACVFGDIDIADHLQWCTDVCREADMEAVFPLWQESREALARESIARGFQAHITVLNTRQLPENLLGRALNLPLLEEIRSHGADVCGENGEYHTFVSDGPTFAHPIPVSYGPVQRRGDYAVVPILQKNPAE